MRIDKEKGRRRKEGRKIGIVRFLAQSCVEDARVVVRCN